MDASTRRLTTKPIRVTVTPAVETDTARALTVTKTIRKLDAKPRMRAPASVTTARPVARFRAPRGRRVTSRAATAHGPPSRTGDDDPDPDELALPGTTFALARFETHLRRRAGGRRAG